MKMPLLLELFSGTGSVGRAFAEAGWEVLSLDGDVSSGADVRCDILQWSPPEGLVPDHVHASPPCTEYSLAKTTGVRNLELADAIVQKTLAILELLRALPPPNGLDEPHVGRVVHAASGAVVHREDPIAVE